jgi:hypothetical protein
MIAHPFPIQAYRSVIEAGERLRHPKKPLDGHIEQEANLHLAVRQGFHSLNEMNLEFQGRGAICRISPFRIYV